MKAPEGMGIVVETADIQNCKIQCNMTHYFQYFKLVYSIKTKVLRLFKRMPFAFFMLKLVANIKYMMTFPFFALLNPEDISRGDVNV